MEAGDIGFVVKRGGKDGSQSAILQITLQFIFYLLFGMLFSFHCCPCCLVIYLLKYFQAEFILPQ